MYVLAVLVAVTKRPTPAAKVSLYNELGNPLIVTTVVSNLLPVVLTPEPLTTTPAALLILTTTPLAGCKLGKDTSSEIETKPPTAL